ncbi:hypothetical protein ACS0TY_027974 [Phlomoides rotata]
MHSLVCFHSRLMSFWFDSLASVYGICSSSVAFLFAVFGNKWALEWLYLAAFSQFGVYHAKEENLKNSSDGERHRFIVIVSRVNFLVLTTHNLESSVHSLVCFHSRLLSFWFDSLASVYGLCSSSVAFSFADKDVAVLHIDGPKNKLRPIPIGISADLLVGQKVYAIGNPVLKLVYALV